MDRPCIVVTGASGFVGRHLLRAFKDEFRIIGLDWRSHEQAAVPEYAHVTWAQADIANRADLDRALDEARGSTRPELMVHLAAYYDFEGDDSDGPYWRTNVQGLRNVLDACVRIGIPRFVFASSVAACRFPPPGRVVDETSPPDGGHLYARTKQEGERLLAEYDDRVHSVIVRFAAMYSDYCEYAPLYEFLRTWLSPAWNARILGGRGASAIPYLHVRDATHFIRAVIRQLDDLEPREIVIASPDGATSHEELFRAATAAYFDHPRTAIHVPRPLAWVGIWLRFLWGRLVGQIPFERPWMAHYVDKALTVDASRTRARIGWAPRPRLAILQRLPLLSENYRAFPVEWQQRNQGSSLRRTHRPNLVIATLLERHEDEIARRLSSVLTEDDRASQFPTYRAMGEEERTGSHRLALTHLVSSVRTRQRSFFVQYCADLAVRRYAQGFTAKEVTRALSEFERMILEVLRGDPECRTIESCLHAHVSVVVQYASDEVQEVFEELEARKQFSPGSPFSQAGPPAHDEHEHPHREVAGQG